MSNNRSDIENKDNNENLNSDSELTSNNAEESDMKSDGVDKNKHEQVHEVWPQSFTTYDDYLKNVKAEKSKFGILHIVVFLVLLAIFCAAAFLLYVGYINKNVTKKHFSDSKVSVLYAPSGMFQKQWDPFDWYDLKRAPLAYKSLGDGVFDEVAIYSDYISGKKKLGFVVDQHFFDINYLLIKKMYIGNISEKLIKSSIAREINRFFKEAKIEGIKADLESFKLKDSFLKNVLIKYKTTLLQAFEKAGTNESISNSDAAKEKKTSFNLGVFDDFENIFSYAILNGLYFGLGDPYSTILTPDEFKDMMENLNEETFGGIGVYIEKTQDNDSALTIVEPVEGTPAFKAGILPGDVILAIDGMNTKNVDIMMCVSKMRGPKGSSVLLTIEREHRVFDVKVVRDDIKVTSVSHKLLPGNIGYIRLRSFSADTADEFDVSLAELIKLSFTSGGKLRGLIVDVRNNGGGYLIAGLEVASRFVPMDKIIHKQVDHNDRISSVSSLEAPKINVPSILLVNRFSASSSEILAAALKDNGSADLVGEKTFGKGSVQQVLDQDNGCAVKLTVAYFLSPNGYVINKRGVTPNFTLEMSPRNVGKDNDSQLAKAIEILKSKTTI